MERVTWKDLRSGMACDLLRKDWSSDEVNARLGHNPNSDTINKYINYLAIDRHRPKKKVHEFEMEKLQEELQKIKSKEKLRMMRNDELKQDLESLQKKYSIIIEQLDRKNQADNFLNLLVSDKEVQQILTKKIKEMDLKNQLARL